jgi:hypothetical protein
VKRDTSRDRINPDALAEGVVTIVEKALRKRTLEIDHLQRRLVKLELDVMALRQALDRSLSALDDELTRTR